jgi:addiction module HigA family antidote
MGSTAHQIAADIDVSPSKISEIVHGARPIIAGTAIRLGLFFRMDSKFWLNLQMEYDIRVAKRAMQKEIEPRIRVFQISAA